MERFGGALQVRYEFEPPFQAITDLVGEKLVFGFLEVVPDFIRHATNLRQLIHQLSKI